MSKHKIKFAKLEMRMVYSKAYNDLNAPSLRILAYLLLQLKWENVSRSKDKPRYEVTNKNGIILLYSTFTKPPFKMHVSSISRAINSLLEHGFIEVLKQGGMEKGHKTIYRYSEQWFKWEPGTICFKKKPFFKRGYLN